MSANYTKEEILAAAGLLPQASSPQYSREEILQAAGLSKQPQPTFRQNLNNTFNEVEGARQQLAFNPLRAGKVAGASVLDTAQGFSKLLPKNSLFSALGGKTLNAAQQRNPYQDLSVQQQQSGDELLKMAPFAASPELLPTKGLGALGRMAAKGTEGYLWDKSAGGNGLNGLALGAAPAALSGGYKGIATAGRTIKNPIVENLARAGQNTVNPQELVDSARAAGTHPVDIGSVIQNPQMKQFYQNVLAKIPMGKVSEAQKALAQGIDKQGVQLISGMKPKGLNGNSQEFLQKTLLEERNKQAEIKRQLYRRQDDIAKKENYSPSFPSFEKESKGFISLINDSPFLSNDPVLRSFVSKMRGYAENASPKTKVVESKILQENGTPFASEEVQRGPSLVEANMAKDRLHEIGKTFGQSSSASERLAGGQYKRLAGLLGADIKGGIYSKGSPALQEAYEEATRNFEQNYAPFFDENITGFLNEYKDPSALGRRIVNPSEAMDKQENISRIMNLLPEDKKNALPYAYLSRAINQKNKLRPKTFSKLISSLGDEQFNALFPDAGIRENLQDYVALRGMGSDALDRLYNPQTGAKNQASWTYLLKMAQAGALGGAAIGGVPGATAGGIAAPIAAIGGSRILGKAFTNPETRQKVVQRILERQKQAAAPKAASQSEKLLSKYGPRILAAQNERNQNGARQ